MKAISRVLLKTFARVARPYLKTYGLLQTAKVFNKSALVWEPGAEKVLVLAPHMDDEVIGCGGALAKHVAAGATVTVIFLTDGRFGGDISPASANGEEGAQRGIEATRKIEAQRALAELGISDIVFFDAVDGQLSSTPGLAGRLRQCLEKLRPEVLYLPFFLEEHPDHRAASQILADATQGSELRFRCYGYEVWTPLFPNCYVRIDDVIEKKKRSLTHYQSQLAEADYLHTALGLNAYRSNALLGGTCQFAEAFCALAVADYLRLYESYRQPITQ